MRGGGGGWCDLDRNLRIIDTDYGKIRAVRYDFGFSANTESCVYLSAHRSHTRRANHIARNLSGFAGKLEI